MQMNKMVRKQIKGINKQVRHLNKDISRNISGLGRNLGHNLGHTRSRGPGLGLFTGLLLLSVPVVAVAVLLSKTENREKVSKFVGTVKESQQPVLGQIQTRFGTLLEQFGFAKSESGETTEDVEAPKGTKNGKNGKHAKQEAETANSGNIQTMGEV